MKENRSVVRVLDILELIAKHDEGLILGQIYVLDILKQQLRMYFAHYIN